MKLTTTLAILAASLALISCGTMEGAGKDIKAGGEKLEHAAAQKKGG